MTFPWVAFAGFAIAASITPGPNNVMVAASAANHGIARTLPHVAGIAFGFSLMLIVAGFGLAEPLTAFPAIQAVLRWVGALWLLVLAYKIATASAPGEGGGGPPLGFKGGALFQLVNPKAWLLVLGVTTAWIAAEQPVGPQILAVVVVFAAATLPSSLVWAGLGAASGQVLRSPGRLRAFNVAMAILLVASMLPVVLGADR